MWLISIRKVTGLPNEFAGTFHDFSFRFTSSSSDSLPSATSRSQDSEEQKTRHSISSIRFGQSSRSSLDRERSASSLPPVWHRGQ